MIGTLTGADLALKLANLTWDKKQKYLEGIVHIPAEPWDGDDKSAEGEPEDKNRIVHVLCLVDDIH